MPVRAVLQDPSGVLLDLRDLPAGVVVRPGQGLAAARGEVGQRLAIGQREGLQEERPTLGSLNVGKTVLIGVCIRDVFVL